MRVRATIAGWLRPVAGRSTLLADCWLAGGLAMILLPPSVMMLTMTRQPPGWRAIILVTVVGIHGSLALRRWNPLLGCAVSGATMLVLVFAPHTVTTGQDGQQILAPTLFYPSSLAFLPMLYSAALQMRRALSMAVLACSLAGVAVASVRIGRIVPSEYPIWQSRIYVTLALLLVTVGAWGLGVSRKMLLDQESAARTELTRTAILAERSNIARDVHDIVAHSLAVIVRQAEGGATIASKEPERAVTALRTIADVGREALDDMRGLLGVLRDRQPHLWAPGAGVSASLADIEPLVERVRVTGLTVAWRESGSRFELGGVGELAVYHVVLEAMTNTLKHAGPAAHVAISLDWRQSSLSVVIADDGGLRGGPQQPSSVPGTGVGLRGLAERLSAVDGVLTFGPHDHGFRLQAVIPRRGASRTGDEGEG